MKSFIYGIKVSLQEKVVCIKSFAPPILIDTDLPPEEAEIAKIVKGIISDYNLDTKLPYKLEFIETPNPFK